MQSGAPPVVDTATQRVYQLAAQAQLFVISAAERRCAVTSYVGHDAGSVVVPPLVVGSHLVLVERDGLRDTRLQLFDVASTPRRLDLLTLRGAVLTPPVAADDAIYLATELLNEWLRGHQQRKAEALWQQQDWQNVAFQQVQQQLMKQKKTKQR